MHISLSLIALVGLSTVAHALSPIANGSPSPPAQKQRGGRVRQVRAGPLLPGPKAMKRAYDKYGILAPAAVILAATNQTGSVQATDLPFDSAYLCPVTVGEQTFMLDFDTGSSDLWTFSTSLPASLCMNHTCYQKEGQALAGENWDVNYGDGSSASGTVYADKVVVGGVTATMEAIEAATAVSNSFASGPEDGILGLGFTAGNTCRPYQCYTFMDEVADTLPLPVFTATLRKNAPGEYDFGFIDSSKYNGTLTYTNVTHNTINSETFWQFQSSGYAIGRLGKKQPLNITAVADTGTSLAYVDQVIVDDFYAPVKSAHLNATYGAYIFNCSQAHKLERLSFFMGGKRHSMPGSYALYGQLADPPGYCFGGVQPNTNIGFTLLGDVFLKSQFVVFDRSVPRIGFARQAGVKG